MDFAKAGVNRTESNSSGMACHLQPVSNNYRMPPTTLRMANRGRPPLGLASLMGRIKSMRSQRASGIWRNFDDGWPNIGTSMQIENKLLDLHY